MLTCIVYFACFIDGLQQISRHEGVGSLWSGTGPSLVLAGNPAIQFMVYEAIKKFLMDDDKKVCELSCHQLDKIIIPISLLSMT